MEVTENGLELPYILQFSCNQVIIFVENSWA